MVAIVCSVLFVCVWGLFLLALVQIFYRKEINHRLAMGIVCNTNITAHIPLAWSEIIKHLRCKFI